MIGKSFGCLGERKMRNSCIVGIEGKRLIISFRRMEKLEERIFHLLYLAISLWIVEKRMAKARKKNEKNE